MVMMERCNVVDHQSVIFDFKRFPFELLWEHIKVAIHEKDNELTTLRFWREEGLHEIKRLKDEVKELRGRLVELDNRSNSITSWNRGRDK